MPVWAMDIFETAELLLCYGYCDALMLTPERGCVTPTNKLSIILQLQNGVGTSDAACCSFADFRAQLPQESHLLGDDLIITNLDKTAALLSRNCYFLGVHLCLYRDCEPQATARTVGDVFLECGLPSELRAHLVRRVLAWEALRQYRP
jgi:hypothetical protein